MLVTEKRPRNLTHWHAGPLLYGDWGTSRLYVLGLAFFFTGVESVFFLLAIALLMTAVAWAYTHICRLFPDGGGVYTAARQIHPVFSVVGATLLLCGYLITAAISVVEALHYISVPDGPLLVLLSIAILLLIGVVNWLGAKSAGTFALVIAVCAIVISAIMAILCLPFVPQGIQRLTLLPDVSNLDRWISFTGIVLALAGVEAVANMTGLMKEPVEKTAKRTIWPVLAEVAVLNILFGLALTGMLGSMEAFNALPQPFSAADPATLSPEAAEHIESIKNTAMEVVATEAATHALGPAIGGIFGTAAAWVFAGLLLSATNTAVMAMVSVLYAMAQDRELPRPLKRLNYPGVPYIALIVSIILSIAIVLIERRPEKLAELYIIGVCGAITSTVASVALNDKLGLRRPARIGMFALAAFLALVTITIVLTRPSATIFAGGVVAAVLVSRHLLIIQQRRHPEPLEEPEAGWLALVNKMPEDLDPSAPRIMLAARGRYQSEFAVDTAKRRGAILFAIYVRTLRVMSTGPQVVPSIEDDRQAQEALGTTALLAEQAGVPFVPIYVVSDDIAAEILDYTVTFGCDTLIMGKSRRSFFSRKLEGDVVTRVAENLPDEVALILRSADKPHKRRTA